MTQLAADAPGGADEPLAGASGRPAEGSSAVDTPARHSAPAPNPGAPHSAAVDREPERALAEFPLRVDDDTLREIIDQPWPLEQIRFSLTKKLATAGSDAARARLHGLRAVTGRLLGKNNDALDDAEEALRCAEATGSAPRMAVAATRLARVLQWRGDFAVADALYQRALDAAIPDRLRASIHHYFGTSCYDQGRFVEALQHFETVVALRPDQKPGQLAETSQAFNAISRRVNREGFGPLPRSRAQILQETPPPQVEFHEGLRRYGYTDANGEAVIPPTFRKAYPFAGGVAWVQPDDSTGWSLIDTLGRTLITTADYQAVGPFCEGLAWVMTDPVVGWFAIDTHGIVMLPPAGYIDARPFHAGLAAVRRNQAWGAVDRDGREVVPMEYDAFRTASSEATYQAGFTSEGLAVVEREGRLGVINRSGDVMIPLAYQQVEIHPVGYLVIPPMKQPDYRDPIRSTTDLADGWGALNRSGELVVETVHPDRAAVLEELEKLMRDAHPIL